MSETLNSIGHAFTARYYKSPLFWVPLLVAAISCAYLLCGSQKNLPARSVRNVVYDKELSKYCTGDIFIPARRKGESSPAAVVIHGGGWITGNKNDGSTDAIVQRLNDSGFVVFDINYRLQQDGGVYPKNLDDVVKAFEFLVHNDTKYGINRNRISLVGMSAGAHLGLLAAYSAEPIDCAVRSVVAIAPATDLAMVNKESVLAFFPKSEPARQNSASPITYVKNAVPTLLIHGTDDSVIPFNQSEELEVALEKLHKSVELVPIKGKDHNFILQPGLAQEAALAEMTKFLITGDTTKLSLADYAAN